LGFIIDDQDAFHRSIPLHWSRNAGSRPDVPFFYTVLELDHSLGGVSRQKLFQERVNRPCGRLHEYVKARYPSLDDRLGNAGQPLSDAPESGQRIETKSK
jgi:hypothetical protein